MFPLDGFTFTWSEKIADFSEHFGLVKDLSGGTRENVEQLYQLSPAEYVSRYGFHNNTNLEDAILSQNEIMIRGSYILVQSNFTTLISNITGIN
jgi:hypothetical protein